MADIVLPRRGGGGSGRRRGVDIPDIGNVPQLRQPSAPVPRVPSLPATGDIGAGVKDFAQSLQLEADRQQKQFDATATAEAQLAFERVGMEEFRRLQVEDDPSRPDFEKSYSEFLSQRQSEMLQKLPENVSSAARDLLRLKIMQSAQGMADSAGRLSLQAGQKRSLAAIDGIVNKYSAQASRDPDFLDTLLTHVNDDLGAFRDTMTPEAERAAMSAARQRIVRSAVSGYVTADRYKDAEAIIASGKFDEDLGAETLAAINADIKRGKAAAKAEIRDMATDHFASLSATGVGITGLSQRAASILDGKDLADFRAREAAANRVFKVSEGFKFATPQEIEAGLASVAPKPGSTRFAEEQRIHDAMTNRAAQILKARREDPAGYAMLDPTVSKAFEGAGKDPARLPFAVQKSLALQEQMGIPESARRVMPKSAAEAQVQQLSAMNPEDAADTMLSLQNQYGKHWPKAYGELVREKLPPEMQVLGTLDAPSDAVVRRDLATALKTGRKTLAENIPTEVKTEVDRALEGALEPWARLELARGANDANVRSVRSAAEMLAYSYAARGKSGTEAAQLAAKALVADRYDILDGSGFAMYVPKGSAAQVESNASQLLTNLKPDMLADPGGAPELTPAQRKAEYLKAARRGQWVLNESGDGAVLLDQIGQPVMVRAGSAAPGPTESPGMLEPGNIDLTARPQVRMKDGRIATVASFSTEIDGREVVLPTVTEDGRVVSEEEAVATFKKTGKHLGMFDTPENAVRFGKALSAAQGQFFRFKRLEFKFSDMGAMPSAGIPDVVAP
jgi:hypothetical protein